MLMRGGGYNYFKNEEFAEIFKAIPWKYPENAVLVLHPEEGSTEAYQP